MDISILEKNSIKLKGKKVTFVIDPVKEMSKTSADAVILLDGDKDIDVNRVTDSRVVISGPGGYEVGGSKISGTRTTSGVLYKFAIDNLLIIVGFAAEIKAEDFNDCDVVVVNTGKNFQEAFVAGLEPKIAILYGDKKIESAKTLGIESVVASSKITVTKDKLPEKMEVVTLG